MKVLKRILSITIVVAVLSSMLIGCGKSEKATQKDSIAPKVTYETAPKLVMAARNVDFDIPMNKYNENWQDNAYSRYIFEKTGVRLEIMPVPTALLELTQKIAVATASGEKLDLICYSLLQQSWIDSGTIITINSLLEKNKGKAQNITKNIPESAWRGVKKFDDIWGFPIRSALGKPDVDALYVRKDWLDKLNLTIPKSTDEIGSMIKAFTENDPDGNGKKDTVGLGFDGISLWGKLIQMWGVDTYREDVVNSNTLVSMAYSDRARAGFKTIGSWFKNGYLDQDGAIDSKASQKKRITNKVGAFWGNAGTINKDAIDLASNGFKDAKWVMVDSPIISSFDKKAYGCTAKADFASVTMVTAAAKDYDSIIKLMDWGYSEEGTMFEEYGLEGREHKIENGKKIKDPAAITDKKSYVDAYVFAKSYNHGIDKESYVIKFSSTDLIKQYISALDKAATLSWVPTDIKYSYSDLEGFAKYPDWRKAIETYGNKFALGDLDPMDDKVWKEFIDASNKYGCQALMDEAAKRYFKK